MDAKTAVHPTDETLAAYGLGKADTAASDAVVQHLETCPDCRQRVAELSDDSFAGRLRSAAPDRTDQPRKSLSGVGRSIKTTPSDRAARPAFGRPPAEVPPELAGSGLYDDVRELGRGGMGVVYLATNRLLNRPEVLKVVNRAALDRPGSADRFLREMQSAAHLHHPNVVAAYAAHQFGDLFVFAMEYAPGEDLARVVKARGPVAVPNACYYAYHAALGLQHAHERSMVHRDIKPANLILTRSGGKSVVKVLDFGLAKATSEKEAQAWQTGSGQMMGTPDYMAPEQARDARAADIRADIYSLGCTLYFLLAGEPPFRGASLYDLLRAHQETPPPPLDAARPEVPAELAAVVARMMAKAPADRFQSPGEVAKVLAPFVKPGAGGSASGGRQPPGAGNDQKADDPGSPPPAGWRPPTVFRDGPVPQHTRHVNPEDFVPRSRPAKAAAVDKPKRKPAPARKRPAWRVPAAVVGVVVAAVLAAAAGGVFKAKTKYGTVVVENVPADATVEVDGETVTVSRNGETMTVTAVKDGERRVKVVQGGVEVWSKDVTVKVGGDPVRVRMEPNPGPPIPPAADAGAKGEWVPLFNGKDRAGWQEPGRNGGSWRVEGGHLVGRGGPTEPDFGFLETDRGDFKNFSLRAEVMNVDAPNKFIDVRMSWPGNNSTGYKVALGGTSADSGRHKRGALWKFRDNKTDHGTYGLPPTAEPEIPLNQWYTIEIAADRGTITVRIDGVQVQKYDDPAPIPSGQIGLACRPNSEVRFRKIAVQELNGGAGTTGTPKPAAEVVAVEGSEWAGPFTGVVDGKAHQTAAAITFTEQKGTAYKMSVRTGNGWKGVIDGTVDSAGKLTVDGVEWSLPDAKPRQVLKGSGEVAANRMKLSWENPATGGLTQGVCKRLPDGGEGFNFPGVWLDTHSPSGWRGVRRVTTDRLTTDRFPGDGPWERDGGLIITHYPGNGRAWLVIDPDNPDQLVGSNGSQTITWTRQ